MDFSKDLTLCGRIRSAQFWKLAAKTLLLIFLYYVLSIGLTFYQQHMLKNFRFPLSVVVCHLVIKFTLAGMIHFVCDCCLNRPRVTIDWGNHLKKLAPTGITSGLDIGFSNWGLELITVSLYTMTKSTAIIFILGFALIFKLEKKSWTLVFIVLMISSGLIMFTFKSTQFNILGFLMVLTASFASGLRWTLAQLVMQKSKLGLNNPLDMVYHVQPWMILAVLPFAIGFEGVHFASSGMVFRFSEWKVLLHTASIILRGGVLAFSMEMAEFLVISNTSSLTLSVAGIFKEICTLGLAVYFNGDKISFINGIGLLLCIGGIIFHVIHKTTSKPLETKDKDDSDSVELPLLDRRAMVLMESMSDDESEDDTNVLFSVLQRENK